VTDQPTSQQPPDEPRHDVPAQLTPDTPAAGAGGDPTPPPPLAFGTTSPGPTPYEASSSGGAGSLFPADRPEIAAGAAFAGGLVLALILKRLAR
jgi:hypothetical protein